MEILMFYKEIRQVTLSSIADKDHVKGTNFVVQTLFLYYRNSTDIVKGVAMF